MKPLTYDEMVELVERGGSVRARLDGRAGRLFVSPSGSLQLRYDRVKRWEVMCRQAVSLLDRLEVKVGGRYQRGVVEAEADTCAECGVRLGDWADGDPNRLCERCEQA